MDFQTVAAIALSVLVAILAYAVGHSDGYTKGFRDGLAYTRSIDRFIRRNRGRIEK